MLTSYADESPSKNLIKQQLKLKRNKSSKRTGALTRTTRHKGGGRASYDAFDQFVQEEGRANSQLVNRNQIRYDSTGRNDAGMSSTMTGFE